jgi:acyl-CoA reductase-like NAD-dependent aldehyde dehydrogenase
MTLGIIDHDAPSVTEGTQDLRLLIGGRLVAGGVTMDVVNPATGKVGASCPRGFVAQFEEAVSAAKGAQPAWSRTTLSERQALLLRIADVIDANSSELSRLLVLEQGKSMADAAFEIGGTAAFFRHTAAATLEPRVLEDSEQRRAELHRRPLGVVAVIVPWNFPMLIMAFKVPPALLTGNTLVIKPAATTPLTTLRFAGLIADIVPPGVVNVVTDANDLGDVLTTHPDVAKVSFTGSTATGLKVMANAAKSLKRVTLELGGNDAGIVLDDADPAAIAEGIYRGAFFNSGQACIALKRLFVPDSMYVDVCQALASVATRPGFGEGSSVNPLQNQMQYDRVKGLLAEAREQGRIVCGGAVQEGGGYFIQPTIVADVEEGMRIVDEEQFGPILPVLRYSHLDDAIRRANATNYGLGASVWSSDVKRAEKVAEQLAAGTVWINQHIDLGPHIPQAGAKHSGLGVELGEEGLHEFTQVQVINIKR